MPCVRFRDRYLVDGTVRLGDFLSYTPKLGFVWKVAPTSRVFGHVSRSTNRRCYSSWTAPGQIPGPSISSAQKAWQFEVGPGDARRRVAWDLSLYDIELWDEIQK